MVQSADEMIDRRRLRRKLGFWRVAAILAAGAAVVALPFATGLAQRATPALGNQIARVEIEGLITEDADLLDLLEEIKDDAQVKALVLRIDSPGGTTVGGETIYEAVRAIAATKPVVAEVGTLAASAGYMIAAGADHIVARRTSIVGSIGVLFQYVDASVLLDKVGVEVNAIKSAPLKAEPSPFAPAPEAAKAMISRLVMDTYDWFVTLVAERRGLSLEATRTLADGSIFSGQQGLDAKLVDAIGGEAEVRRWLEDEKGVEKGLEIVDREPDESDAGFPLLGSARSALYGLVGLDPKAPDLGSALAREAGHLDGLVSLWQPR